MCWPLFFQALGWFVGWLLFFDTLSVAWRLIREVAADKLLSESASDSFTSFDASSSTPGE